MPAQRHGVDHWDTFCHSADCRGGEDSPAKQINTEPMLANETILLRDTHNKIFHKREKLAQAIGHPLYTAKCRDCGTGGMPYELTLRPVEREEADRLVEQHNAMMHPAEV